MANEKKPIVSNDYEEFDKSPLAKSEEEILKFWQENDIFQKSLTQKSPNGEYVFYEGPPTANGRPGIHHLESRAFKDAIPRYKTMQGYHVNRRAGWDTHGLPVELEVEKQLGFSGKPDIEKYGIAEFNEKCRQSVLKYVDEWQAFTDRIGYWLDHSEAYYTFTPEYMESVWWVFSQADKNGLLYKDYKVLPWCSRCGTALSSHELAQGYKVVKDLSITAKFELIDEPGTYVLAWTTTPWTLPGNIALAVGQDITYVKVKSDDGNYILAKDLIQVVFSKASKDYEVIGEMSGKDLVGLEYRPLYPYLANLIDDEQKEALGKAYKIYSADFVTTEDGTGVVHTAVMYGQDDFVLGDKIGLPKFHLVNPEGKFIAGTEFLADRFVKDEEVSIDIIKDLAHRREGDQAAPLLFHKEKYEHTYPHCWRCKTPLIYYARDSWYIRMSEQSTRLIDNNQAINWEPDYIKEGRMGEWLRGVKDWAVSRERYWGTPLPIWEDSSGDRLVIDSVESFKEYTPNASFIIARHAEGKHNVANIADSDINSTYELTEKGEEQARALGEKLKNSGIDLIISSPLQRSRQTAKIIAEVIGYDSEKILSDNAIKEINFGEFNGHDIDKWKKARYASNDDYQYQPKDGENFSMVKRRVAEFLDRMTTKHKGKKILVLTHGAVLETAVPASKGMNLANSYRYFKEIEKPEVCSIVKFDHNLIPRDENGELNLHRPYIDQVVLKKDGKEYRRVQEVMDVWFDSGSMPWAQVHYPFSADKPSWWQKLLGRRHNLTPNNSYPADYISEAIDQTRGWFYVMQAIAGFMKLDQAPYKNVICLGHILDAEGQKMSKSRGNTVNPWEMIATYGADALRFWMYSVNQPGEPKNFDEQTVDEIVKKLFNLLRNSVTFYQMFEEDDHAVDPHSSPNVLDKWVLSLLAETHRDVTANLDNYKLLEATRSIREFVGDLSQWYIRRSRDRFKGDDGSDKSYALATTRYVFQEVAKLLAPFTPYLAEEIWQQVKDDDLPQSVHLASWSRTGNVNQELLTNMARVRDLVSEGLALRAEAGIKARQPLASFTYVGASLDDELAAVVQDELNVKQVISGVELALDQELTPELLKEGELRELLRGVQSMRKKANLIPSDDIILYVDNSVVADYIADWHDELNKIAGVNRVQFGQSDAALTDPQSTTLNGTRVSFTIASN